MTSSRLRAPFLKRLTLLPEKIRQNEFPFNRLSFLAPNLSLDLCTPITFLVGENGSGKSTLLEAIAKAAGFPAMGGSRDHLTGGDCDASTLAGALRLSWLPKVSQGYFFRAESFFGVAGYLDAIGNPHRHGGCALHAQSHGEAFLALFRDRLDTGQRAIYLLDEPEAALSPTRQLAFLRILWDWYRNGQVQAIVATHSPLVMSLPHATILSLDGDSIRPIQLEETEHYRITRSFLADPARMLYGLLGDETALL